MPRKDTKKGAVQRLNVTSVNVQKDDRDPNGINSHLKIEFQDVIGEQTPQSLDCIWSFSAMLYQCCIGLGYNLMTLCCGICIAVHWGVQFGILAFQHIWFISPCLKVCNICCFRLRWMHVVCLNCCCKPWTWAIGHIFVAFKTEGVDYSPYDHYKVIKQKSRHIQPNKRNKVEPKTEEQKQEKGPSTDKKKEKEIHVIPAAVVVAPQQEKEAEAYYGNKTQMQNSVRRQLNL